MALPPAPDVVLLEESPAAEPTISDLRCRNCCCHRRRLLPAELVSPPELKEPEPFSLPLATLLSADDEFEEQAICKGPASSANAPAREQASKVCH